MTNQEIIEYAEGLIAELDSLKEIQVGYSNYKRVMASYQMLMRNTITLIKKLAENQGP